jgi:hypothetical protein
MVDNVTCEPDMEDAERERSEQYGKESVGPGFSNALAVDQQYNKDAQNDAAINKNQK